MKNTSTLRKSKSINHRCFMAGHFRPLEAGSWGGRNREVTKSLAASTTASCQLPALKTNRQMVTAVLVQKALLHAGEQSTAAPAHCGTQDCFCQKHHYFKVPGLSMPQAVSTFSTSRQLPHPPLSSWYLCIKRKWQRRMLCGKGGIPLHIPASPSLGRKRVAFILSCSVLRTASHTHLPIP